MKKYLPIALALGLSINIIVSYNPVYSQYNYNMEADYAKYYDQGIEFYNKSEYSKAIEQFSQALKMVPKNSAVRNNLAVSYISRGTFFHNTKRQYEVAADNYREAIYYLKYDAPEEAEKSPNAAGNLDIAEKNLANALLGLGKKDTTEYHFNKAKELRTKGQFRPAIVEYYLGLEKSPDNAKVYGDIGDIYRVLQNYEKATIAYQKAIKIDPNNADIQNKLGLTYEKTGKLNSAIQAFNQASALNPTGMDALNSLQKIWEEQIKLNPRNAAAHANLGTILQKKGDFDGALEQYNAAELIDPNNIVVRLNLGTLYQAKGDIKTAIRAYDTIITVDPKNHLAHYYKATALKQLKDYDNATKELNVVLQLDPNNALAKKELNEIAKEQGAGSGNYIDTLKELASKDFLNAKAQYDVAYEAHSNGDLKTAIEYYRKAIDLDPKLQDAYLNAGVALKANKDYEEALKMLKKAEKLDPANNNIPELITEIKNMKTTDKYQQAISKHQDGKLDDAIKLYNEAAIDDPNNPDIYTNLGAALQSKGDYKSAISNYQKALSIEPKSSLINYYLGTCYHAQNQMDEAISHYNKALKLDPNNQDARKSLESAKIDKADVILSQALDEYNRKSYNIAQSKINEALKISSNNPTAYYYMGLVLEAKKDVKGAISNYRKATELDSKMDSAFYALAVALDTANDKSGAKRAYTKFLNLAGNKNDAFVKYAKERLKQL